jgi:hypothetical protein
MHPPFVFSPFQTDKSWYDKYWLTPVPPEPGTRTGRLRWFIIFLFQVRRRSPDSQPRPGIPDRPASQSLASTE